MAFTVAFTVGQTPLRGVSGLPSRASLPRVGARQGAQAPARHRLVVVAARKPERPFRTVLPGLVQGTDALFRVSREGPWGVQQLFLLGAWRACVVLSVPLCIVGAIWRAEGRICPGCVPTAKVHSFCETCKPTKPCRSGHRECVLLNLTPSLLIAEIRFREHGPWRALCHIVLRLQRAGPTHSHVYHAGVYPHSLGEAPVSKRPLLWARCAKQLKVTFMRRPPTSCGGMTTVDCSLATR